MNENLSQIVADLLAKSKGGEDLSSRVRHLRGEIKKVIGSEDSIFGKFCGLLESLREVIPEEQQRYHAAIKALSATSKLSQQEIIDAVNDQIEELKILEKGLMPALPGWRDDLKAMEARSKELKEEIADLRGKVAQLESEEQGLLKGMAAKERDAELVEKAMRELFTDFRTEITSIKKKVEEFTSKGAFVQPTRQRDSPKSDIPDKTAERAVLQPVPQRESVQSDIADETEEGGEEDSEVAESPAQPDTKWQKKCPMCGGRMNFHENDQIWMCYSCAYEESTKDGVQGLSEHTKTQKVTSAPDPFPDLSPPPDVSSAAWSSNERQGAKKKSAQSGSQPSTKTKTCPSCRKKMNYYPADKAWRCPFCEYERSI